LSRFTLFAGVAAALLATPALAQTSPDVTPTANGGAPVVGDGGPDLTKDTITVGIGAAYVPDYDGSRNYRAVPAPVALGTYKGLSFTLVGNRLAVNVIPQSPGPTWNVEAGPVGVVNFNRTSNSNIDNRQVRALPERDTAIEVGGYVGLSKTGLITSDYDKLTASISSRWDVSGKSKSYVVTPSLTYLTPLSLKAAVGLLASGTYVGTGYARYYYGVSAADSRASGLPIYTPSHDWNSYTVGGFATYSLTGNLLHGFKVIAGGTYSRELSQTARSPLISMVGNRNQWIGAAGLAYTF
jgi:outer membrane scaffolding protein for murein synthesis (MipA/OmpV family)